MRITHQDYQDIVRAGIHTGELDFTHNLVKEWLKAYPGDIESEFYSSKILILKNQISEAKEQLNSLVIKDLEYLEAYKLLSETSRLGDKKKLYSIIHAITGEMSDFSNIYTWAVTIRSIRSAIKKKDYLSAERLLRPLLGSQNNNLLVAYEHCKLETHINDTRSYEQLTGIYNKRWPTCLQFSLLNAKAKISLGEDLEAVSILHECVSLDPGGQVIKRIWGNNHEFRNLWPEKRSIELSWQIPSSIAVSLDWNLLSPGENSRVVHGKDRGYFEENSNYPSNDSVMNKFSPDRNVNSERMEVYVILSTKRGLEDKYGAKTAEYIIENLHNLKDVINKITGWEALICLPDNPESTRQYHTDPVDKIDPWKIKLSLNELNKHLLTKGKSISALIIIGGHEIVPFHNLPNPTDDSDEGVYSDNPYATSSDNFLLPEWPVGRLPDEAGSDPGLLLEQIRQIIKFHEDSQSNQGRISNLISELLAKIKIRQMLRNIFKNPKDFGYSTAVWRRSSLAAFRPIGKGGDLRVTPPYDSDTIDLPNLMKAKCAYFNLHGLADTPDWYGQRDFSEEGGGPDFPVALSAKNIDNIRNNIDMVFTESCYGGFTIGKTIENSMALKLISINCQGYIGSTCISYGSVFTPLIGADLLAFIYWKYLKEGHSFGDSFFQAKIGFIKVLHHRQGYLDGEDQKTLMSFVLYGDPLGYIEPDIHLEKITQKTNFDEGRINAISDGEGIATYRQEIQSKIPNEIKEVVSRYIPSLHRAEVQIKEYKVKIDKFIENFQNIRRENKQNLYQKHTQILYKQKTTSAHKTHEQFVRLTMDESGKITKLAVSR